MLGNRIVALGDSNKIHARSGPNTRLIGAKDATLVPGFAECLLQDRDVALGNKVVMGSDGLANGDLREKSALLVVLDLRTSGGCEMRDAGNLGAIRPAVQMFRLSCARIGALESWTCTGIV